MEIVINYDGDYVEVNDNKGNAVYYVKKGDYLKILFADFNDVLYDKTEHGWKRSKRGAVSKKFYDWYENVSQMVYDKHYRKINN